MPNERKPWGYWNSLTNCHQEALKYTYYRDFRVNSQSAYNMALKNGWLEKITKHLLNVQHPSGHWNYERCKKLASLMKTRTQFKNVYNSAFQKSYRKGWLDDFFPRDRTS